MQRIFTKRMAGWLISLAVLGIVVWGAFLLALGLVFDQAAQRGKTTLGLTVAGINGTLGRYQSLPQLIADNNSVRQLLTVNNDPQRFKALEKFTNLELKRINTVVAASNTYVLNSLGVTLAASNFATKTSFVGKNFSYRPYFQDAIAGRLGKFFALGTTSLKRGYYFSSPVRVAGEIVGVVVVKVNIDGIESTWQARDHEIIVTDENGVIFMSSKPDWLFKSIKPLSAAIRNSLNTTRRYDQSRLGELPMKRIVSSARDYQLATVTGKQTTSEYLTQVQQMTAQGWDVHIFSSSASARTQAYIIAATVLFVLVSIMLATAFFFQRRARLLERMNAQHEARHELEKQVKVRTFDLHQANTSLLEEVSERKAAENELRKTQADLVQAGKLAALGQMSAALSHELNQPLGAVKSYADNAATFLDRGRKNEARENVTRISALVDRMASISKHLRNFARKPNEKLSIVPVGQVINDAVELLGGRLKETSTKVNVRLPSGEVWIKGGQIRLQQVVVNLINNAVDAMADYSPSQVDITVTLEDEWAMIVVRDFGAGIKSSDAAQIFDPFFTTKGIGKGLGLGLSISYNIIKDFGGVLSAATHKEGGAVFSIKLKAVEDLVIEAAQ